MDQAPLFVPLTHMFLHQATPPAKALHLPLIHSPLPLMDISVSGLTLPGTRLSLSSLLLSPGKCWLEWGTELLPGQRQTTGGMPMQGEPGLTGNLCHATKAGWKTGPELTGLWVS